MFSWRRLGSLKVSVALIFLLFVSILGGTIGQAVWGAAAVQTTLFSRVFFPAGGVWWPGIPLILAFLGVNLVLGAWLHLERSLRAAGLWGIHLSLALFCFGSLGFSLSTPELILGLVPGASADRAFVRDEGSQETVALPFVLKVESFHIETYPQSTEPSDYVSKVVVERAGQQRGAEIRMNTPLREADWTIYQSSVEWRDDAPAPVFKLMHNPWAPFPSVISVLFLLSLLFHFGAGLGARGRVRA